MKKLWIVPLIMVMLVTGCSTTKTITQDNNATINLQQMANDIATLKSNVVLINAQLIGGATPTPGVSQSTFNTLQSEFNTLKAKVDALPTIVPPTVTVTAPQDTTQLTNMAASIKSLQDNLAAISASIQTLQANNTSMSGAIGALQSSDAALAVRISALEHPPVTTTTPPPTTTAPVNALALSLAAISGGVPTVSSSVATTQNIYLDLKYTNNSNNTLSNVKFQLNLLSTIPAGALTSASNISVSNVGASSPIWVLTSTTISGIYTFTSLPGVTVQANSNNEIILVITITWASTWTPPVTPATYQIFPNCIVI